MDKHFKSSLDKWGPDLYESLCEKAEKMEAHGLRSSIFIRTLWNTCGFCVVFRDESTNIGCTKCPLYENYTCASNFHGVEDDSPIKEMHNAFINKKQEAFEMARKEFIVIMVSHEDKFPKTDRAQGRTNDDT